MKSIFFNFVFLLVFLVGSRLINMPPNFTPIIATAILAPHIFSNKMYTSIALIILSMFISDLFLGLHKYLFFTYLPLIIIILFSSKFNKFSSAAFFMTIFSPLIFFIISNFGVWFIGDFYEKSLSGLILCYTMGLPFLKNTFLGTITFIMLYLFLYNIAFLIINKFFSKITNYNSSLIFLRF